MKIILPGEVAEILEALWADGHSAYVVGGCVRDSMQGVTPQDWDIATSAAPARVKHLFKRTVDTGLKHGTVTVLINRLPFEVTTYRVDGVYLDGRRPSTVTFTANIEEDLSRRDFTMNAIAYSPLEGFVDPFGGREDIKKGIIRAVGNAAQRFKEDALRMLRAIRFAGQLGFKVETETLSAITPLKENLRFVSAERIREELTRLLLSPYPQAALLLESTGTLPFVLNGRNYHGCLPKITAQLQDCPKHVPMVYTLFLSWAATESEKILRDLRFDNKTIRETGCYIQWLPVPLSAERYEIKKILNQMPYEYFNRWLTLKTLINPTVAEHCETLRQTAAEIIELNECFRLKDMAVNGNDLADRGIPRGKATGDVLAALLDTVMREPLLNRKETLLTLV